MSLLLSDSLVGVVNEQDLEDAEPEVCGSIRIDEDEHEIDAFLSDGRAIRVHVVAQLEDALRLMRQKTWGNAELKLGTKAFTAQGKILQVGWEQLPHGGRLVISVGLRDK
jgi:hypothetical protein